MVHSPLASPRSLLLTHPHHSRPSKKASPNRFKGVRMRSWGKWVSEIRIPNTRDKIWLGSYSAPEAAARAYDFAVVSLRGVSSALNFPESPPRIATGDTLTPRSIRTLAAAAANSTSRKPTHNVPATPEQCSYSPNDSAEGNVAIDSVQNCARSKPASTPAETAEMQELQNIFDIIDWNEKNLEIDVVRTITTGSLQSNKEIFDANLHPFEELWHAEDLARHGFIAVSEPVTSLYRFDIETTIPVESFLWE